MKLHADHRTVFELQYGMLGRQVAYFERAEDAAAYARLINEASGEEASQNLQIDGRIALDYTDLTNDLLQRLEAEKAAEREHSQWLQSECDKAVRAMERANSKKAKATKFVARCKREVKAAWKVAEAAEVILDVLYGKGGKDHWITVNDRAQMLSKLCVALTRFYKLTDITAAPAGEAGEAIDHAPAIVYRLNNQHGQAFAIYLSDGQKIGIQRDGAAAWLRIEPTPIVREAGEGGKE